VFTSKDKLAEWLESYAQLMELNVWSLTKLQRAKWDGKRWAATVERHSQGGTEVQTIWPYHIIQATGMHGGPQISKIEGINDFQGSRLCHSSQFSSAQSTAASKRIVVVESGVSGHDIAQDFYEHGHNVTIVQRSPTCIDRSEYIHGRGLYLEGGPATEDANFLTHSIPSLLLKIEKTEQHVLENKEYFEGLEKAGFRVDKGPDGAR
jgi:cation diffusion facilitator CzcD-associated flavoprotein CzcO